MLQSVLLVCYLNDDLQYHIHDFGVQNGLLRTLHQSQILANTHRPG